MTFPSDFLWGVATSSYQIEGAANEDGRGTSIWDTFCASPGKVARGESGLVAADHYHRYKEDIQLMRQLGVDAYRFSFAWPRLFPDGDSRREERGFAFYDRLIDEILEAGIEPVATLYHWDLPQALQERGGWGHRQILQPFSDYAIAIAEHFGDRVTRFTPINEPWVVSWLGYGSGVHAPGIKDKKLAIAAAHHTVVAHNQALQSIKSVRPNALVGPVLNQSHPSVDDISDPVQMFAAKVMDTNQNTFWMDGIFKGKYSDFTYELYGDNLREVVKDGDLDVQRNDWLGINFYFNGRIGHTVPLDHPTRARVTDLVAGYASESKTVGEHTDMGWPITPFGLSDLLLRWTREFGDELPQIFITENGCAYDDEPDSKGEVKDLRRIEYLRSHLKALESAIESGADVGGYFQWSLLDNFEWAVGYDKRFGIIHVDYDTQKRTIKDSALFYKEVIGTNGRSL